MSGLSGIHIHSIYPIIDVPCLPLKMYISIIIININLYVPMKNAPKVIEFRVSSAVAFKEPDQMISQTIYGQTFSTVDLKNFCSLLILVYNYYNFLCNIIVNTLILAYHTHLSF